MAHTKGMDTTSFMVDIRTYYGGRFLFQKGKTEYVRDGMFTDNHKHGLHLQCGVWSSRLTLQFLRSLASGLVESDKFELWYKKKGHNLTSGKTMIVSEIDIINLLNSKDSMNFVTVYVIQPVLNMAIALPKLIDAQPLNSLPMNPQPLHSPRTKRPNVSGPLGSPYEKKPNLLAHKNLNSESPLIDSLENQILPYSASFQYSWDPNPTLNAKRQKAPTKSHKKTSPSLPLRRSPRNSQSNPTSCATVISSPKNQQNKQPHSDPLSQKTDNLSQQASNFTQLPNKTPSRPKIPIKKKLQFEGVGTGSDKETIDTGKQQAGSEGTKKKKGKEVVIEEGKGKGKQKVASARYSFRKRKAFGEDNISEGQISEGEIREGGLGDGDDVFTDSEDSDIVSDPDWELNDIDEDNDVEDDFFGAPNDSSILDQVEKSLGVDKTRGHQEKSNLVGVDELEVGFIDEVDYDSDELRSLDGSDSEVGGNPSFNPNTDFGGTIVLKEGLRFGSNVLLRKALVWHSVQKGYDFYYTHNNRSRLTARCRNRCDCPWNSRRSTLPACKCKGGIKCHFMVHATRLETGETFEIKTMNGEHGCTHARYNRKASSEFLAEKYIEFWRNNIDWKIKKFKAQVLKDHNVDVSYTRCWLARCRAKLIIYGNGKDQYGKVWDYAAAVKKYNEGSSAVVVCDNIDRPPPIFKRIYICLQACKEGFIKGCRPIIGLDGCHLKGSYPGICLVAVGKDGNNNIFPLAWAVVEVENTESWVWFIECLKNDLGKEDGLGLTFMSDRQKGLIDALRVVVPKAEVRYCVRHIWANFKLHFSGQMFRDLFWRAATATTKADFDNQMEGIKSMSTEAWTYLNNIGAKHWSRHAFDVHCKSNMLLNNICESFNAVLKECRDKPILTHMEWMRRYVMKRNCEKREGVLKFEGRLMPYVSKHIKWAIAESRLCQYTPSSADLFEVDYKGDTWIVNLKERSCTCYQWNLTGLPCQHGMGCILKMRLNPEDFVHDAYSKARYVMAYEPAIYPLPGAKHWERSGLPEPLPPPIRNMPGRPSARKRRKEPGEGQKSRVKRQRKTAKCSNCGELGHYKKTCKNVAASNKEQRKKGGRPFGTSAWAKEVRERNVKRKTDKERYAQEFGPSSSTNPVGTGSSAV